MAIKIERIDQSSPYLEHVKQLWRANSQWLGFFPAGAFDERARKRQIIVAAVAGKLAAYIIFYTKRDRRVVITHLCVAEEFRKQGLAARLIERLRRDTKDLLGIGLHCRRDYPAWSAWPALGFVAVKERAGRSADGTELTYFWMPQAGRDLFTAAHRAEENCVDVVLDANIFFDLDDPTRNGAEESQGLLSDWLRSAVRLCLTDEIYNEVHRHADPVARERRLRCAATYEFLGCAIEEYQAVEPSVREILGEPKDPADTSDIRHLARAIAAQATSFVTRDQGILNHADDFYARYGLSVLRPAELIGRAEELRNERLYQRERLPRSTIRKTRKSYAADLASTFQNSPAGEKTKSLERRLRAYAADPTRFACYLIEEGTPLEPGRPLALYVIERRTPALAVVPVFRFSPSVKGPRTSSTLLSTLLSEIIKETTLSGASISVIEDFPLEVGLEDSMRDAGFARFKDSWVKVCLQMVDAPQAFGRKLREACDLLGINLGPLCEMVDILLGAAITGDPTMASELEHVLRPGKILGCGIPSYIVPIRPNWAADLFDSGLAEDMLWAGDSELAMNTESVYYRSLRPNIFTGVGRILWYVSQHKRISGSKKIRACSRLTEVSVGSAKTIYRRFRSLGVYKWEDILGTVNGSHDCELMAIRFDDTERFTYPATWADFQRVLARNGINSNIQSPVAIAEEAFIELYTRSKDTGSH